MSRLSTQIHDWIENFDRSVSPVIGTILVVAVTVILAAVIGATTFGFTDSLTSSPPQADLSATQGTTTIDDNNPTATPDLDYTSVTITHQSGESISKDNIRVTVNGEPAYATLDPAREFYSIPARSESDVLTPWDSVDGDTISAGDETIIILATTIIEDTNTSPGVVDEIVFLHQPTVGAEPGDYRSFVVFKDSNPHPPKANVELESGDTVRMIWESGDRSVPLVEHEVQ